MKKISMIKQIIIAMIVGAAVGIIFGERISGLKLVGDIFLRLIQMTMVILVMGAVIEAVGNLNSSELGRLGIKILFWFSLTTMLAAVYGSILGKFFKPGEGVELAVADVWIETVEESIGTMILEFFPSNIFRSMVNSNMIQTIIFAIFFGIALMKAKENHEGSQILSFIKEFNLILIKMINMVMKMAPPGICALIAYTIGTSGPKVILPLIKFLLVLGGGATVYLILFVIFTGIYCSLSPVKIMQKISKMTLVALTTTSSAVALPTKMEDSEEKLGVSKRVSGLVNPLGMTLNSNGLAMFLSISCITIAQIYGIELEFAELLKISVLSSLACLGTVAVPGGGIVALTTVFPGIGLPMEGIALLTGIDWFSGMFRTMLNVDIDALVAMMIAKDVKELDYDKFQEKRNI